MEIGQRNSEDVTLFEKIKILIFIWDITKYLMNINKTAWPIFHVVRYFKFQTVIYLWN